MSFILRYKSTNGFMDLIALCYERNSPLAVSHTASDEFRPF